MYKKNMKYIHVPVVGSDPPQFFFLEHYLTKATSLLKALTFAVMNQQHFFLTSKLKL
jgi:hypothetical protein